MKKHIRIIIFVTALLWSLPALAEQATIRILHVNDFHGFAEPHKTLGSDDMVGGAAFLAQRAYELRREKPTILVSAGDMIQGHNWANFSKGESVIEMMNAMGFDAMVVGNHEFDFGQEILKIRIAEAGFPLLGANVKGIDTLKPYIIKEVGGIRIAVIGVVTEDTPLSTHPKNVSGLGFLSPEETVSGLVAELKGRVDATIVVSHIGHQNDRALAEKVKGIDVIIGGHSHTKVLHPPLIGGTLVAQAWEHGKALGVLDLKFDNNKLIAAEGRLEEIHPNGQHPAAAAVVEKYAGRMDSALSQVIGTAAEDLDGQNVRRQETNLANLIADIMRETAGAEAAIINGGSIRTSIRKGPVRVKDIYSVLPFDNYIVAIRLTGAQIRDALEHGVSAIDSAEGRFPQVSGISFTFSASSEPGRKVREIFIAGKSVEPDREYILATNDFLAAGGDGYTAFGDAVRSSRDFSVVGGMMKGEKLYYSNSGTWLRDVVIDYIIRKGIIGPVREGRIMEVQK